ncbi:hypothetical protein SPRG_06749 [Saprolegnia parasitica CBS 223.65]|uniref:Pectinesterase inhibitor domain-containing protein n=1 Tax=Saprolegnia parasitica (strain CBS 223.65) TaxID=695850 RepID=A0A067CH45_SAPPC|nr:hypothetical protein SPRG_06749 [Saprolegnia parasitica CBS 223.65]KDO28510.1 hypothetical protein SPRG_06749 [Saprolegnia parasitica CBS 223.65]|eukprot:XP_012200946.1 hypothetical protein SPRG_06749 [Saprolegnia parasitica CBS 223.65]
MLPLRFVLTLLTCLVVLGNARCYCERYYFEDKDEYRQKPCNDLEAQSECNRANDQVTDMVNSAGRNADLYLETLVLNNASVTPAQASYLRSKLSEAIEWGKPVGDCANGLTTETRLVNTDYICVSMPLFQQCDTLAKTVPQYFSSIHNVLAERLRLENVSGILENGKLTTLATEFLYVIKLRDSITRESNKIRCQGYNATVDILRKSAAPASSRSLGRSCRLPL